MMDYKEDIENNQIMLFVVKHDKYQEFVRSFTKNYLGKNISSYVALSRPYQSLVESFKKQKVNTDNIFFIDTSTKMTGKEDPQADNCLFIESPSALTNLSIAINKVVEASEPKFVFFDSLSTLLIYNPEQMIIKFTKDLINKLRAKSSKFILICLDGNDEANIIEKLSMFVDKLEKVE
ncbi:MAG: hypothetical protein ACOCZ6_05915 [Nanoarchaeota archaeon]